MKAAVVSKIGDPFAIEDLEIAAPMTHEVLVTVHAVGLCHSDLSFAQSDFGNRLPMVLGHEFAGIVTEVGSGVTSVGAGDRVVGSLVRFCGRCAACASGASFQCTRRNELLRRRGEPPRLLRADGAAVTAGWGTAAFAEQCLVHENQLVVVPEAIPFPQAAILGCATITGAGAVINAAAVRPGSSVVVIGLGGVGLNAVSGAALSGASTIIAIDRSDEKLELAKRFGATDIINAANQDPVDAVRSMTDKAGADYVFEVVGVTETAKQAVQMAGTGGGVYIVGMHKPGEQWGIDITADLLTFQRSITGVYMGSSNIRVDIPKFANLYLQGRLNLDDLIADHIGLSEINKGFDQMRSGRGARYVITDFAN